MFRTQAAHNVANKFVNTDPATDMDANDFNARQEELCHIIERGGGTVAASSAADVAAGQHQVADFIGEVNDDGTLKTLACRLCAGSHHSNNAAFSLRYIKHSLKKLITLDLIFPSLTLTDADNANLVVLKDDLSDLPLDILPASVTYFYFSGLNIRAGSNYEPIYLRISSQALFITYPSVSAWAAAAHVVQRMAITYPIA